MDETTIRLYSIIPAAGHSRRMGQSKLLLPWRADGDSGDPTVIDRLLQAWTASSVDRVLVVVRADDRKFRQICQRWPVTVVVPEQDPSDMKASVQIGLRHLAATAHPRDADGCFIAPADLPTLSADIVDAMATAFRQTDRPWGERVLVPRFGDRRGHPVLMPWPLTAKIAALEADAGINRIVDQHEKFDVPLADQQYVADIDTPAEYEQLLTRYQQSARKTGTK